MPKLGKKVLCFLLSILMLPLPVLAADEPVLPVEEPGMAAFALPETLPEAAFTDVAETSWYYDAVRVTCALGLVAGVSEQEFSPSGTVTLNQALAVAVRIYEKYHDTHDDALEEQCKFWYEYPQIQSRTYGIYPEQLPEGVDLERAATRAEVAEILYRALPAEELPEINTMDSIPDYPENALYWNSVIALFRGGVVSGSDAYGTFYPENSIRRSELASMLMRLVCPERRTKKKYAAMPSGMEAFALPSPLPELPYTDVRAGKWYYRFVRAQYALDLMVGTSDTTFSPDGNVTLAQALAIAVRVYEHYYALPNGYASFARKHWYDYYMARGVDYGLMPEELASSGASRVVTRAEVAEILCRSLPAEELPPANEVTAIPDYDETDLYWQSVLTLYRAGVLSGMDASGRFSPDSAVLRSELASLLTRLVCPEYRAKGNKLEAPATQTIVYGQSGAGRDLTAYRLGDGENVMVVTFAIHGWEDNFNRDGQLLVDTAEQLRQTLLVQYNKLIVPGNWSVYILPTLNPDGLYDGWTCNGPGRCTTTSLAPGGKGIDLNRCFPYRFSANSSSRNYNGTQPLQAVEAQALAKFTQDVRGSGHNVLIDTHGWYQQTIVSGSINGPVYQAFHKCFPSNLFGILLNGKGYYSSWAAYELGYDACLFEFPSNVTSAWSFQNHGYADAYIQAICQILETY